jgi:tetratricopeptide (TPR) repeat protein
LAYHADQRAYLGLGILLQKDGRSEDSKKILEEGVRRYPHDGPLHICLGISLMNMERYEDALKQMLPFKKSRQALGYIADCYQALNDYKNAALFRDQIEK